MPFEIIIPIVSSVVTGVFSYLAAVNKAKREIELESIKIKQNTESEIKLLEEKTKYSAIENYINNPHMIGELSKSMDDIVELSKKAERLNNQSKNINFKSKRKKGQK